MEAKELRIGNWVLFEQRPEKIDDPFKLSCPTVTHYDPIPLTEEILIKAKFQNSQTQDKFFTIGNGIGISTADNKFRIIKGNFVCQIVLTELEFVHQLQNICYDLGEELEFSL
jgi:hypothetical protein